MNKERNASLFADYMIVYLESPHKENMKNDLKLLQGFIKLKRPKINFTLGTK